MNCILKNSIYPQVLFHHFSPECLWFYVHSLWWMCYRNKYMKYIHKPSVLWNLFSLAPNVRKWYSCFSITYICSAFHNGGSSLHYSPRSLGIEGHELPFHLCVASWHTHVSRSVLNAQLFKAHQKPLLRIKVLLAVAWYALWNDAAGRKAHNQKLEMEQPPPTCSSHGFWLLSPCSASHLATNHLSTLSNGFSKTLEGSDWVEKIISSCTFAWVQVKC